MSSSMTSTFLITAIALALPSAAQAQQTVTLTEATRRALARNHDIRVEREAVTASAAGMQRALGEYDPQVRLELGARKRVDPETSLFSGAPTGKVAASLNSVSSSASMTQLFKTGAVGAVTASTARESTNNFLTLYAPAYTTSLGVELRQPLLRNRVIDPARASLRITALDRDRSSAGLDRRVLETMASVEQAYWQLVAARREVNVRRETMALAEQQRADTQVRIEARTVAPADIAEATAELERRRGDLLMAEEQAARAERALKQLMLDESDADWSVALHPGDEAETAIEAVDVAQALGRAAAARPELSQIGFEIKQHDIQVTAARGDLKPAIDVFVAYTAEGLGGRRNDGAIGIPGLSPAIPSSLNGALGTSWQSLFNGKFTDASVGLSISMPVGTHEARGQLASAVAARRQSALRLEQTRIRIANEVRNAVTAVDTAASRIAAASAGVQAAEMQLRAEQDRFAAGATSSFFVLTRQTELANAQLTQIRAVTDYRIALTELGRATGTLVKDRGVSLDVN